MEKEIKQEELFIPKTKHKALKIILAIILIGAIAVGGYFLYKEKFNNPNKTVISIIEDAEKTVKKNSSEKIYKFNGILKIDANLGSKYKPITDIINNLDLQFILESDVKNKIVNGTLNTKYKKEQLADVNIYTENNTGYILLQDIYDKYLKLSLDDTKANVKDINIDENDIKILTNSIMKATKSTLEKLEFKRVDATIKIDDEDRNVYNNYVELNETEAKKLITDIINILMNDTEFTKVLKKLTDNDDALKEINESISNTKFSGKYKLNFYTNKNILNQKLVSIRLENTTDSVTSSINYDKVNDDEVIVLINTSGGTISSRIKKTKSIFNINLNVNILGMTVKLDLSSNYETIKDITKPDISNSKKIEELTEDEEKAIGEKIQSNKGMLSLIQDLSKLNGKIA